MRLILWLIFHCSAVMPSQTSSIEWHVAKGWNEPGYHYNIRRNGDVEIGRPENVVGAHYLNYNRNSIGICYEGGIDDKGKPADTRTPEQKKAMLNLKKMYPNAVITDQNAFSNKACPRFDAAKEYLFLQP